MPRIGPFTVDEERLLSELADFQRAIIRWAKSHSAWHDAAFHVPFEYNNERPRIEEVLLLTFEGPLYNLFNGGWDDPDAETAFCKMVEEYGLAFDLDDHTTMSFRFEDQERAGQHLCVQRLQWVQRLMAERLTDVRSEVFEHFANSPDDLKRIGWRQFEELLDAIFRNQGFRTEIGSGGNDGGVDLRIYQSEALPELVSLLQAKRYSKRPIHLEAVAALFGIAVAEQADAGIFVTTSRFQPSAKKFALSTEKRIDIPTLKLIDGRGVREWCSAIAKDLNAYFSSGTVVPRISLARPTDLTGRIVVAHSGYGISTNEFCIIEIDLPREAILRPIGSRVVSGDIQVGEEVPDMDMPLYGCREPRFVAFKSNDNGGVQFWGNRHLYFLWDGTPRRFNRMD